MKKFVVECIVLGVVVIIVCLGIYKGIRKDNNDSEEIDEKEFQIISENTDKGLVNVTGNLYTYNMNISVNQVKEEITSSLSTAIASELVTIEELTSDWNKVNILYSGAKEVYRNLDNTIILIRCSNGKDVIGNINLDIDKNLCMEE